MNKYEQVINRAARLCSGGEKCEHEMFEKLQAWGLNEAEAAKGTAFLVENKFIDDERFTSYFVRDKLKLNKWGRIKIAYTLRQKGVKNEVIDKAIAQIKDEEYFEILKELLQQKIKSIGGIDSPNNKAKVLRFAAQRGFTSEEIFKMLPQTP